MWFFISLNSDIEFIVVVLLVPHERMQQVSLYDFIIPKKEYAEFWIRTANKYRFIDQVSLMQNVTNDPKSISDLQNRDVLVIHHDELWF